MRPLDKEVLMEMLSAEYGWLPDEIKRQSSEDINNYIKIIKVKRRMEKDELNRLKHAGK
jgi:hypothetical protein